MPTTKLDRERAKIAHSWKEFRHQHLYTQVALAEALGISRRTVQYVESGKSHIAGYSCMPMKETQAKFNQLKARLEKESK